MDTLLSNPDHVSSAEEDAIVESIANGSVLEADFYPVDEGDFDQNTNKDNDPLSVDISDDDNIE